MTNDHFERCKARVLDHVGLLMKRARLGQINASAVEGVMESYIEQPAFAGYREQLRQIARERTGGSNV